MGFIAIVGPFWHTYLTLIYYLLPDLEIGFTAGLTDQQAMLSPPRHKHTRAVRNVRGQT
jgi:hypothetical protein